MRSAYPYEDRPKNVCFKCWVPGDERTFCTKPRYEQKLKKDVAVTLGDGADEEVCSSITIGGIYM